MSTEKAVATAPRASETVAKNNHLIRKYNHSGCKSRGKLRENLTKEVIGLLACLKNPSLRKSECEQAVQLLESTWRKFLAVVGGGVSV